MVAEHLPLTSDQRRQVAQFDNPAHEARRLLAEAFGTFLLVLVAAGADVVNELTHGGIGRVAAVTTPGLMVMAIIMFMGANSGAHLNPVVTIAFAVRRDFSWRRVPGYVLVQLIGATLAALTLRLIFGSGTTLGVTVPGRNFTELQSFAIEALLTLGLVSVILGAASGAQNIGALSAVATGGYIALAGLWASPVTGASMNPARSFGPALISGNFSEFWLYLAGPLAGALLACGLAFLLRGPGGGRAASLAAQGNG
ncbi:MAG: aquaporin [Pseudolysinimonas sp.]